MEGQYHENDPVREPIRERGHLARIWRRTPAGTPRISGVMAAEDVSGYVRGVAPHAGKMPALPAARRHRVVLVVAAPARTVTNDAPTAAPSRFVPHVSLLTPPPHS